MLFLSFHELVFKKGRCSKTQFLESEHIDFVIINIHLGEMLVCLYVNIFNLMNCIYVAVFFNIFVSVWNKTIELYISVSVT